MEQDKSSSEDTLHWISEVFREIALEKKALREREEKDSSKREKFWKWLSVNGSSLTVIVTILSVLVGGMWTAQQYLAQRRAQLENDQKAAELHKQTLIAQFAGDLGDKDKRNGAALAIAVLAKEAAIPILESHLRNIVSEDEADKRFRTSLVQAFISIGTPSISRLLAIQKEASIGDDFSKQAVVHDVAQQVIVYFLNNDHAYFVNNNISLAGIEFRKADLRTRLDGLNFNKARFTDSAMCAASFKKADLSGAQFNGTQLGDSNMEETILHGADFSDASMYLDGVNLNRAEGQNVNFSYCHLESAHVTNAVLTNASFWKTSMRYTDFSNSDLSNSDFKASHLYTAKFIKAVLAGASMVGADLENADFSGADLGGVHFNELEGETPVIPDSEWRRSEGAFVRGANFTNARNLDDRARVYLCKWGAVNVPGGCNGIIQQEVNFKRQEGFGASSCW